MIRLISTALLCLFFAGSISAKPDLVVAADGSGDFTRIQEALDSAPDFNSRPFVIYIKNGVYNEKIFISKSNIVLAGENRDSTIIIFAELRKNWRADHPDDYGAGVINIRNNVSDIAFYSLTVYNNFGSLHGDHDHQFAIRGGGGVTRIIIEDCRIIADGGDTLALWNTDDGMYYHNNCYFEGYVDYVCPRGFCFIENSSFFGHNLTASIWHDGSNNKDQKLVIRNSYFDGVAGFPLGRFHRDAQFFLINCRFSENMADKKIFFAPSDPPRILSWGEDRIYFYNCHRQNSDFSWYKDNLPTTGDQIIPDEMNALRTFNYEWDPESVANKIKNKLIDPE